MHSRNLSVQMAVQTVVDALPLFTATLNFTSALEAFEASKNGTQDVTSGSVSILGAASAVISAAATVSVASTLVSVPAVVLATGHNVHHSADFGPARMTVQS